MFFEQPLQKEILYATFFVFQGSIKPHKCKVNNNTAQQQQHARKTKVLLQNSVYFTANKLIIIMHIIKNQTVEIQKLH